MPDLVPDEMVNMVVAHRSPEQVVRLLEPFLACATSLSGATARQFATRFLEHTDIA